MEAPLSTTVQHVVREPLFPVQRRALTFQEQDARERAATRRDMARLRKYQEEQLVAQYRQEARVPGPAEFARKERQAEAIGTKLSHQLEELGPAPQRQTTRKSASCRLHNPSEYEMKQIRRLGPNQLCEDARRHLGEIAGRDAIRRESVAERNLRQLEAR